MLRDQVARAGNLLDKRAQAEVVVDVVYDHRAARPQRIPRMIELAAQVALGVEAVVDEKVDRAELLDQPGQLLAARAETERPAIPQSFRDGERELVLQARCDEWRQVDAPKGSAPVSLQSLEDEASSDAVGDAGFHGTLGAQVPSETVCGKRQSRSGVVPTPVGRTAGAQAPR